MTNFSNKITQAQRCLQHGKIDGWLLFDFRKSNDLACQFCEIEEEKLVTRRFLYWIPAQGEPIKIVHAIENPIKHLPGDTRTYKTWQDFQDCLKEILVEKKHVAMEYSHFHAIPVVSKVDAGMVELIQSLGPLVVSSADLLQCFTSVFTPEQWKLHLEAADFLARTADRTWEWIKSQLQDGCKITEYDVQQFMTKTFAMHHFVSSDLPICAVNENSADPHYTPSALRCKTLHLGDFILIDLWCKKNHPHGVYADITRVAVAGKEPSVKQQQIFNTVKQAQNKATAFIAQRIQNRQPVYGYEVDRVCRKVISDAGYGEYFTHRTGHNIDIRDHGSGANIDDFETHDTRQLIPNTCFSIEPGIYLPGEFGIRLEYDVFIHANHTIQVTGGVQEKLLCLFEP